jgi:hypothetical protein
MRKRVMPALPEEVVMRGMQVVAVLEQPVQALAVVPGRQGPVLVVAHPDHPALLVEPLGPAERARVGLVQHLLGTEKPDQ